MTLPHVAEMTEADWTPRFISIRCYENRADKIRPAMMDGQIRDGWKQTRSTSVPSKQKNLASPHYNCLPATWTKNFLNGLSNFCLAIRSSSEGRAGSPPGDYSRRGYAAIPGCNSTP